MKSAVRTVPEGIISLSPPLSRSPSLPLCLSVCGSLSSINDIIIQTPKDDFFFPLKLLSDENKVPKTRFEAWKVAGSATYKQYETVCLFSHENNENLFI